MSFRARQALLGASFGKKEEFLCSRSCCVQFLYWPPVFKVATKKQQLHRVLCGGKATTNIPGCCSIIVLTKGILTQSDLCVNPYPNQLFREGSEGSGVPQDFLASVPLTSHSQLWATCSSTMFSAEGWMNPWKCAQQTWMCSSKTCSILKITHETWSLRKWCLDRAGLDLCPSHWLLGKEWTDTQVAEKGFIKLDSFARLSSLVWISSPLVLVVVPNARERESLGSSHSKGPRFSWAPGDLQLPETPCRASLACEKETSVIPPLCPALNCSACRGGSQTSTLPISFPGKVFPSENCWEQRSLGFTLEALIMHRWKGGRGSYLCFPLPGVYNFRLNTALSLTSLTGAQPPLLPLNLSHTMCTHWDSRAEGRTSHHKYSRRQLAIISHHAINNHILQLLTAPLWSYLHSEMFSIGFHMLSINSGPVFRQKIWICLQNRGLVTDVKLLTLPHSPSPQRRGAVGGDNAPLLCTSDERCSSFSFHHAAAAITRSIISQKLRSGKYALQYWRGREAPPFVSANMTWNVGVAQLWRRLFLKDLISLECTSKMIHSFLLQFLSRLVCTKDTTKIIYFDIIPTFFCGLVCLFVF